MQMQYVVRKIEGDKFSSTNAAISLEGDELQCQHSTREKIHLLNQHPLKNLSS